MPKGFMIQPGEEKFLRFYLPPEMEKKYLHRFSVRKNILDMTYNFDPDKWYDNELYLIQSKLKTDKTTKNEYDEAVEILDKKLEEMWERLDGTYQIDSDN
ncbi:MAG: hypothetical protein KAH09_03630 [Desulfobacula sp.]|nr:hypothetical protein [Desulfobacula sp.]